MEVDCRIVVEIINYLIYCLWRSGVITSYAASFSKIDIYVFSINGKKKEMILKAVMDTIGNYSK